VADKDLEFDRVIGYYQWVPLILMVQAFCFHMPHMVSIMVILESLTFLFIDFTT